MNENDILSEMNNGEQELFYYCKSLKQDNYKLLPNLILNRKEEGTNQIDLVILTNKGIFVIEYKGISARIYGNEFHKHWTAYYEYNKKSKFRNPVKQNENHIKTINNILNSEGLYCPIYNVIVFPNDADLSKVNSTIPTIKRNQIFDLISKYPNIDYDMEKVFSILINNNILDLEERKKHLEYIYSLNQKDNYTDYEVNRYLQRVHELTPTKKFIYVDKLNKYLYLFNPVKTFLTNIISELFWTKNGRKLLVILLILFLASFNFSEKQINNVVNPGNHESHIIDVAPHEDKYIIGAPLIGLGSTKEEVRQSLGEPDKIEQYSPNDWKYNNAILYFDSTTELLIGWADDSYKTLRKAMEKPKANFNVIRLGSTQDDVLAALGAPTKIGKFSSSTWEYGTFLIYFDTTLKKVTGWMDDSTGSLKKVMDIPQDHAKPIQIGSTKEDVLFSLGAPNRIDRFAPYTWYYDNLTVCFDYYYKINKIIEK